MLLGLVVALIIISILYAFAGLIWWGIGSFIVWAFGISFAWTYWHGVATAIIVSIVASIFRGDKE